MMNDRFGNLLEWGQVRADIDDLRGRGALDEHQPGLARILRFTGNWRLVEYVLQVLPDIRQSADILIAEVTNILVRDDLGLELRVLAARALGHLLAIRPPQPASTFDPARVLRTMTDLAARPAPPLLTNALRAALAAARGGAN